MTARQTALPHPPPQALCHSIPHVRLGEFDLGGVLYHANYYHLLESAREALLRDIGVPYSVLLAHDQHLTLVEAHQHFVGPIHYGEALRVWVWVTDLRRSALRFDYAITPANDAQPRHYAWTRVVFVQVQDGRFVVRRLPDALRRGLQQYAVGSSAE